MNAQQRKQEIDALLIACNKVVRESYVHGQPYMFAPEYVKMQNTIKLLATTARKNGEI
tara:strand:+ start:480 stop:653 length:174 start_codon:yes stop_codon:yes gene_type:complete